MAVDFLDISEFNIGTMTNMLKIAYQPLINNFPNLEHGWKELEETAQEYPRCFFITTINKKAIGFSSINPSNPDQVHIGHNVILPEFQNRGIGKLQLKEQLKRCCNWKIEDVWAITGAIPFFLPARKMYASNGFEIISSEDGSPFDTLKLRKKL